MPVLRSAVRYAKSESALQVTLNIKGLFDGVKKGLDQLGTEAINMELACNGVKEPEINTTSLQLLITRILSSVILWGQLSRSVLKPHIV
jgi:hypothetical protein